MKTLKCDLCKHEAMGETFEGWMDALKSHYFEAHMDYMKQKMGLSDDEKKTEMEKWMKENRVRFDAQAENK